MGSHSNEMAHASAQMQSPASPPTPSPINLPLWSFTQGARGHRRAEGNRMRGHVLNGERQEGSAGQAVNYCRVGGGKSELGNKS